MNLAERRLEARARGIPAATLPNNRLLQLLPREDLDRLLPMLELVEIRPRQVLHHWRMPMQHVYFIERGLVSVAAKIDDDTFVEVWLIGSEGFVGVPIVLSDDDDPPHRRVVQVGGHAWRVSSQDFKQALRAIPSLPALLNRYAQVVLLQTSQSGACNAHHPLWQRLARWLLLARDALASDSMTLTHELLARLLGVRRASVSECLASLEDKKLVEQRRGTIRILDAEKLERTCCDCFRIIRREYQRQLQPREPIR
jgi:CRP-like cAMP-binding protein